MLLILLYDNKFVQFLCTGSSFLHIMITHNVDLCKKRAPLHASNHFSFESYTFADDENDSFYSISEKLEQSIIVPLWHSSGNDSLLCLGHLSPCT